jgi:hypothetical protein
MYDRKLMKRLLWTILFLISASILTMMVGCAPADEKKGVKVFDESQLNHLSYSIYVIDSCEYIIVHNGNATWGSHKGNCNNPIHNR